MSNRFKRTPRVTPNSNFADNDKLLVHFRKHGSEFRAESPEEYLQIGRHIIGNGIPVEYLYKGEKRIGFVKFMGNKSKTGEAKFGFVGTTQDGDISTVHVESGNSFWKLINRNPTDQTIRPAP